MRAYGAVFNEIPMPADTVQTMFMTGGSSAQAMDWQSSAAAAFASAAAGGIHLVRFTGMTSAGAQLGFSVNLVSTHAIVQTSGTSVTTGTTAGSTGNSFPVFGSRLFQVPSWSTGFSVASPTSGYISMEAWRK